MELTNIRTYAVEYVKANWKILLAVLILGALVGYKAHAGTLTATWTNPTTNTDSSAIPVSGAGSLTGTRVEYGSCVGTAFGTKAGEVSVTAPATTATTPDLAPGTYCLRAFSKNTYGSESAPSGVASKTISAPTPSPPTLVTIAVAAYDVKFDWRHGTFEAGPQVGRVALNTACSDKFTFDGYAMVSPKAVTFTKRIHTAVIVAKCARVG
jgi:predicted phage tail protein